MCDARSERVKCLGASRRTGTRHRVVGVSLARTRASGGGAIDSQVRVSRMGAETNKPAGRRREDKEEGIYQRLLLQPRQTSIPLFRILATLTTCLQSVTRCLIR